MLITVGNVGKLGKLSAQLSLQAKASCNPLAIPHCGKKCYACRGNCALHQLGKWHDNLVLYRNNPQLFEDLLLAEITAFSLAGGRFFRYFVSGDFPDDNFLAMTIRIAKKVTNVRFLAFSKQDGIVNKYLARHKLPENLCIVLSQWRGDFVPANPHNLPTSNVYGRKEQAPSDGGFICPGKCPECGFRCWSMQAGEKVWFKEH